MRGTRKVGKSTCLQENDSRHSVTVDVHIQRSILSVVRKLLGMFLKVLSSCLYGSRKGKINLWFFPSPVFSTGNFHKICAWKIVVKNTLV